MTSKLIAILGSIAAVVVGTWSIVAIIWHTPPPIKPSAKAAALAPTIGAPIITLASTTPSAASPAPSPAHTPSATPQPDAPTPGPVRPRRSHPAPKWRAGDDHYQFPITVR